MQSIQVEQAPDAGHDATPTSELLRDVLTDAKALFRLELALAKEEMAREAAAALSASLFGVMAAIGFAVGLAMLAVGVVLALGGVPWVAFVSAFGFLAIGGIALAFGWARLPKALLERTRKRIEATVTTLEGPIV